ncbi:MAG: long-chain fatty acid--CoA ligase [Proteobacteria bacterium]|nr:long-chain fatty acid--CoA ligase [Pseudomonadota bacterium]
MKSTTICHHVFKAKERSSSQPALLKKQKDEWVSISWSQYFADIETLACGLLALGLKPKDRVAIMSNTRYEWSVADYAILGSGAVAVPIYQTVTAEDLEYILNNSQARYLFIEDKNLLKILSTVQKSCTFLEKIICYESPKESAVENLMSYADLVLLGKQEKDDQAPQFAKLSAATQATDTATLIYTSGTTGRPKGVVLTHEQIISEVSDAFPYMGATREDLSLTFLPYAHILGRIEHWGHMYIGFTMAFAESLEKIKHNLVEVRPTFMIAVPRIFEKIYAGIMAQAESNPIKSRLFKWALGVGKKAGDYRLKRSPVPLELVLQLALAHKLVLSKVKDAFGGRLRFCVSGGAPLAQDIALFFHSCDILILEGYGLTETTAAICVNTPFDYRFGSVGKPIGDVQLKIAEDGEVLVKSKKVMKEYYLDPDSTRAALQDGWFATGDIGEILPSGDLKLTDRKKDLIKTAGGKYVAPQRLENLLKLHPFISQVLIHGDQKKYIVALITLDRAFLKQLAKDRRLVYDDLGSLTQHPYILEFVRKAVAQTNKQLASFESIKRFTILKNEFTVEAGELTPSLKVKRKFLDKKFHAEIEALYKS